LLLLDGLDEVSGDIQTQLSSQIQSFADTYSKNPLIVTCRLAAQDYYFRGFTVMEMADFAPSQITTFVQKWFTSTNSANPEIGAAKAEQFLEQIQRPEHQSIRELAVTPILLHLACLVFQERSAFPKKRSRLYQTGLDILLVRWDKARGIQRDQTYHLSVSDRVNILSQIAATTFEQGKYFFEKAEIIPIIASYLGTLPDSDTDPETLWLNSEAVLQTIVLQHGLLVEQARDVYSFSHVTFQEYLTARRIFTNTSLRLTSSDSVIHADVVRRLQQLAEHVMDTRWHEVIALTIELLPHPNLLLMGIKEHINDWTSRCETVQVLLQWVARKTQHVIEQVGHDQASAIRAFYLSLCQNRGLDLVAAIAPDLTFNLPSELALDLELIHALRLGQALIQSPSLQQSFTLSFALDLAHRYTLSNELQQKLQTLIESLIDATQDLTTLEQWCQTSGDEWMRELRQLLIEHRDIGYLWQFNATQHEQLQRHYQANLFFMRCLRSLPPSSTMIELTNILLTTCNSDCAFSKSVAPYA
jgi:predicted NACHT family NTPase